MTSAMPSAKRNFILQQGLSEPAQASCSRQYSALLFQPRLVGLTVLTGAILRSPVVFFVLTAVLWWSAWLPRLNPFDAVYNAAWAARSGMTLTPAPAPRRFAQFLAGSFALTTGILLTLGWRTTALVIEVLFLAAIGALVFFGFCLGSLVFHLIRGRADFARRTLPWARGA